MTFEEKLDKLEKEYRELQSSFLRDEPITIEKKDIDGETIINTYEPTSLDYLSKYYSEKDSLEKQIKILRLDNDHDNNRPITYHFIDSDGVQREVEVASDNHDDYEEAYKKQLEFIEKGRLTRNDYIADSIMREIYDGKDEELARLMEEIHLKTDSQVNEPEAEEQTPQADATSSETDSQANEPEAEEQTPQTEDYDEDINEPMEEMSTVIINDDDYVILKDKEGNYQLTLGANLDIDNYDAIIDEIKANNPELANAEFTVKVADNGFVNATGKEFIAMANSQITKDAIDVPDNSNATTPSQQSDAQAPQQEASVGSDQAQNNEPQQASLAPDVQPGNTTAEAKKAKKSLIAPPPPKKKAVTRKQNKDLLPKLKKHLPKIIIGAAVIGIIGISLFALYQLNPEVNHFINNIISNFTPKVNSSFQSNINGISEGFSGITRNVVETAKNILHNNVGETVQNITANIGEASSVSSLDWSAVGQGDTVFRSAYDAVSGTGGFNASQWFVGNPIDVFNTSTHEFMHLTQEQLSNPEFLNTLANDPNNAILFGNSMQDPSGFMSLSDALSEIAKGGMHL